MAINLNEYHPLNILLKEDIKGLYEHNELAKFFYRYTKNGKRYKRVFDYSEQKGWDKKQIHKDLSNQIKNVNENPDFGRTPQAKKESAFKTSDTLNNAIDKYFKNHIIGSKKNGNHLFDTTWNETKHRHYIKYIANELGKVKIVEIKPSMIRDVIANQKSLGLKPRTIKTTTELLSPIFDIYVDDEIIDKNPTKATSITNDKNIKREKTKKEAKNPMETAMVFAYAIKQLYVDNPYYLSLYLFAMLQRRKNEILQLRWENIDFKNNIYTCIDVKNGETQDFYLPHYVKNELLKFKEVNGWVYASPTNTGKGILNIEKQTTKIKKMVEEIYIKQLRDSGIIDAAEIKLKLKEKPPFSLHYFRNIGSSLMQKMGMENYISGAMGHASMQTKDLYVTVDYLSHSEKFSNVLESEVLRYEEIQ